MNKIRTLPESESRQLYEEIRQGSPVSRSFDTTCASKRSSSPFEHQGRKERATLHTSEGCLSLGSIRSFGNLPLSSAVRANGYPVTVQAQQLQMFTASEAYILPLTFESELPSDPMANAMLSFRNLARSLLAADTPASQILSSQGVDLTLFFRDRRVGDPHTVSTWACEWMKAWPFLPSVTRLAAIHYAVSFMRWYILPCSKTYAMVSPLLRPSKEQLAVPHPVSLDLVHLPVMRQALLTGGKSWVDRVTTDSHHFHWGHGTMAAVMEATLEPGSGAVKTLRPEFIEQCDMLSNWTLYENVLEDYPDLPKGMTFHHGDSIDPAKCEPLSTNEERQLD